MITCLSNDCVCLRVGFSNNLCTTEDMTMELGLHVPFFIYNVHGWLVCGIMWFLAPLLGNLLLFVMF